MCRVSPANGNPAPVPSLPVPPESNCSAPVPLAPVPPAGGIPTRGGSTPGVATRRPARSTSDSLRGFRPSWVPTSICWSTRGPAVPSMSGEGATIDCFRHLAAARATAPPGPAATTDRPSKFPMLERIREIESSGRTVRVDILRYGMSPTEALTVEAAVHDASGLAGRANARQPTTGGRRASTRCWPSRPSSNPGINWCCCGSTIRIGPVLRQRPPRLADRKALDRSRLAQLATVGGGGGGRPGGGGLPDPPMGAGPGPRLPPPAGPGRRSDRPSSSPSSAPRSRAGGTICGEDRGRLPGRAGPEPGDLRVGADPGGSTHPGEPNKAEQGTPTLTVGQIASLQWIIR